MTETLSSLKPNPENPRKIEPKQLEMLKKSLEQFGDLSGVIVNRVSGNIVSGHQRHKVLPPDAEIVIEKRFDPPTKYGTSAHGHILIDGERFAYREISVDAVTEKAINLACNQHGGEFDLRAVADWVMELDAANVDLDLLGFTNEELANIMAPVHPMNGQCDEDEVPEPRASETRVVLGDLWTLGNHRLLCGDSTSIDAVERLMAGEKADMVFTDPPYGVSERTNRLSSGRGCLAQNQDFRPVIGDDSIETAVDAYRLCEGLGIPTLIFWGANYYASALPEVSSWIIWDKRDGVRSDDNADCELAWCNNRKPARVFSHLWKGAIRASERSERKVHPTQKPVALAEWCFENYGSPRAILDLFGGSGSTLIACEKTDRKCFMMELDPHYCSVILDRWVKFTGKDPVREDGTKWSELSKA